MVKVTNNSVLFSVSFGEIEVTFKWLIPGLRLIVVSKFPDESAIREYEFWGVVMIIMASLSVWPFMTNFESETTELFWGSNMSRLF